MTNGLNLILKPAYEPGDGSADGAQLVDGEWWHPIFGCDSLQKVVDNVRSMLQLPSNYIDPEHQGQDRELLQAFYQACNAEGGTADDIHLRGIKAALATLQTAPSLLLTQENMSDLANEMLGIVLPEGDGVRLITRALELWGAAPASAQPAAIAQPAEDPTDDSELLSIYHAARNDHQYNGMGDGWQWQAERAATVCGLRAVLARYGRPTFQPIPVSERLPGPEDCCPNPRNGKGQWCWGWAQHGQISYSGCWRMTRRDWLSAEALAWAPWWALPMPGSHLPGATEEAGEEQP